MSLASSMSFDRSKRTNEILNQRFADKNCLAGLKKYRTLVRSLQVTVRETGLIQLVLFYFSKNEVHHIEVLEDLFGWVGTSPMTQQIAEAGIGRDQISNLPDPKTDLVKALHKRSASEIALLEAEIIEFAGILKRSIDGRYKELDASTETTIRIEHGAQGCLIHRLPYYARPNFLRPTPGVAKAQILVCCGIDIFRRSNPTLTRKATSSDLLTLEMRSADH